MKVQNIMQGTEFAIEEHLLLSLTQSIVNHVSTDCCIGLWGYMLVNHSIAPTQSTHLYVCYLYTYVRICMF